MNMLWYQILVQVICCLMTAIVAFVKFQTREKGLGIFFTCVSVVWAIAAVHNIISIF